MTNFYTAQFWVNSIYIDEEGTMVTVVVVREGYQGRADVVSKYKN